MVLTLRLPAEAERKLRERAEEHGMDVPAYVEELVAKDLGTEVDETGGMTLTEILAPAHKYARAHGHTEEEIGQFVDAEVKAYRAERRARRGEV